MMADAATLDGTARRAALRHPVHFVCRTDQIWPELRDGFRILPAETIAARCIKLTDCWIVRTWYELRRRGLRVTISDRLDGNAINVATRISRKLRVRAPLAFLVVARGDAHAPKLGNFVVRQNGIEVGPGEAAVMHWRQPGILPRDSARGNAIRSMHFKGNFTNLSEPFRSLAFRDALAARGVALHVGEPMDGSEGRSWADYSTCDLILAVRNLTVHDAMNKPPSKLLNAWWGEAPPLLGPEPAFFETDAAQRGWTCVRTTDDVLAAVTELQADGGRYQAMIDYGRKGREASADATVVAAWHAVLDGPVAVAFSAWRRSSAPRRAAATLLGLVNEPRSVRRDRVAIHAGPRILDLPPTMPHSCDVGGMTSAAPSRHPRGC